MDQLLMMMMMMMLLLYVSNYYKLYWYHPSTVSDEDRCDCDYEGVIVVVKEED